MQEALQNLQLHDTELTRDILLRAPGYFPIMIRCRGSVSSSPR